MSEYKRFMAYLYAYERGQKAGNCGFAKVTVKNDDGFVNLHVKLPNQKTRMGCAVYLYYRSEDKSRMYGVSIGEFVIVNGVGEGSLPFSATTIGMERRFFSEMGGLYLVLDNEGVIATEWEDIPIRPESFQVESGVQAETGCMGSVEQDTQFEEGLDAEEIKESSVQEEFRAQEMQSASVSAEQQVTYETIPTQDQNRQEVITSDISTELHTEESESNYEMETESKPEITVTDEGHIHAASALAEERPVQTCMAGRNGSCPYQKEERNRETIREPEECKTAKEPERISPFMDKWTQLKSRYPVVSPFDNDDSITCIRIQPKDICLLNRKEWILGNNNFLLHGYCNYRYLLLGKIEAEGKYIICVPGNFYSKEKMMASMFGFQNFKMAGNGELRQGEFGYWYREIAL